MMGRARLENKEFGDEEKSRQIENGLPKKLRDPGLGSRLLMMMSFVTLTFPNQELRHIWKYLRCTQQKWRMIHVYRTMCFQPALLTWVILQLEGFLIGIWEHRCLCDRALSVSEPKPLRPYRMAELVDFEDDNAVDKIPYDIDKDHYDIFMGRLIVMASENRNQGYVRVDLKANSINDNEIGPISNLR
nr:hypothetical protein [Tanacetum cinerariifolium]